MAVYEDYVDRYEIVDTLFPFTDRFAQLLFADLKKQTGIPENADHEDSAAYACRASVQAGRGSRTDI